MVASSTREFDIKTVPGPLFVEPSSRASRNLLEDRAVRMQDIQVKIYDIRRDKHEESLLDTLKQSLNNQPQTMPTLLLYDGTFNGGELDVC